MNYAIIKCVNGNFELVSEHGDNFVQARTAYYGLCQSLSNASDVVSATVAIIDGNLSPISGFSASFYNAPVENN